MITSFDESRSPFALVRNRLLGGSSGGSKKAELSLNGLHGS